MYTPIFAICITISKNIFKNFAQHVGNMPNLLTDLCCLCIDYISGSDVDDAVSVDVELHVYPIRAAIASMSGAINNAGRNALTLILRISNRFMPIPMTINPPTPATS
jgi:hypothetical protein